MRARLPHSRTNALWVHPGRVAGGDSASSAVLIGILLPLLQRLGRRNRASCQHVRNMGNGPDALLQRQTTAICPAAWRTASPGGNEEITCSTAPSSITITIWSPLPQRPKADWPGEVRFPTTRGQQFSAATTTDQRFPRNRGNLCPGAQTSTKLPPAELRENHPDSALVGHYSGSLDYLSSR